MKNTAVVPVLKDCARHEFFFPVMPSVRTTPPLYSQRLDNERFVPVFACAGNMDTVGEYFIQTLRWTRKSSRTFAVFMFDRRRDEIQDGCLEDAVWPRCADVGIH